MADWSREAGMSLTFEDLDAWKKAREWVNFEQVPDRRQNKGRNKETLH